jgi:His Kinase A (phospho-acceptor) domain
MVSHSTHFDPAQRNAAQGTPFIDFLGFHCVLKRTVLHTIRLKDEFLAAMSHELRTPLNAVLGMSEALQEEVFGVVNDKQLKSLRMIERSGRHLLSLINDILDVSKISAGKLELNTQIADVAELCKSSLALIKQQAHTKNIQVNVHLPIDAGLVLVDECRIRQVLINLLSNAMKFTNDGGDVTLTIVRQDQSALVGAKLKKSLVNQDNFLIPIDSFLCPHANLGKKHKDNPLTCFGCWPCYSSFRHKQQPYLRWHNLFFCRKFSLSQLLAQLGYGASGYLRSFFCSWAVV